VGQGRRKREVRKRQVSEAERPRLKTALLWIGGILAAVGAAFQIAGVTSMLLADIVLIFGVWIFTVVEVWFSDWVKLTGRFKPSVILAIVCLTGYITVCISDFIASARGPVPKAPIPGLAMQCDLDFMPIQIPPGQRITLLLLHLNPEFTEQINNTGHYSRWPLPGQATIPKNQPMDVEKCEVESLTQPVEQVSIPLSLQIGKTESVTNVQFPFLPQNQTASFYIVNECPDVASGIIPDTATLKRLNSSEILTVPLSGAAPNSIGKIIMPFSPSRIKWSNNPNCGR